MIARFSSLLVWGLAAAAAVGWGLRVSGQATPVPAHASVAAPPGAAAGDVTRVLGVPPAVPEPQAAATAPADSRVRLLGVVAAQAGRADGVALLALDDKPARALRIGQALEPGLVLQTVGHRRVELSRAGGTPLVLELPALPEPRRGNPGEGLAAVPNPVPARPGMPLGAPLAAPGGTVGGQAPGGEAVQADSEPPQALPMGGPPATPPAAAGGLGAVRQ